MSGCWALAGRRLDSVLWRIPAWWFAVGAACVLAQVGAAMRVVVEL